MTREQVYTDAGLGVSDVGFVELALEDDDGRFIETRAYEKLYDYFCNSGEMPYGVAKCRTGEPDAWILDYLDMLVQS